MPPPPSPTSWTATWPATPHAQSRFGRIADPLADRLLIDLALVLLVYHQRLEWWLAAPVLLRDALLAAVFRARHEATEVQVNMLGKAGTAAIMLSLILLMLTEQNWPKVLYVLGRGAVGGRRRRAT